MITLEQASGDGGEGVIEVIFVVGDYGDVLLFEGLEGISEGLFVGNGANDKMWVGNCWIAVGMSGSEDGVGNLDGEMWVGDIESCDAVEVGGVDWRWLLGNLEHDAPLGVFVD